MGSKDKEIRKSEFVTKTQFIYSLKNKTKIYDTTMAALPNPPNLSLKKSFFLTLPYLLIRIRRMSSEKDGKKEF